MPEPRRISVHSYLFADIDEIWKQLAKVEALQYISAPYATFTPLTAAEPLEWKEGSTTKHRLRIFGFIPMGVHEIYVNTFSREKNCVYTEEKNKFVSVWNHTITIETHVKEGVYKYTDTIDIYAGRWTALVALWGKAFCRHRQSKLFSLLFSGAPISPS